MKIKYEICPTGLWWPVAVYGAYWRRQMNFSIQLLFDHTLIPICGFTCFCSYFCGCLYLVHFMQDIIKWILLGVKNPHKHSFEAQHKYLKFRFILATVCKWHSMKQQKTLRVHQLMVNQKISHTVLPPLFHFTPPLHIFRY